MGMRTKNELIISQMTDVGQDDDRIGLENPCMLFYDTPNYRKQYLVIIKIIKSLHEESVE